MFFVFTWTERKITINVSQWTRLNHVPWAANSINDNNFLECFSTRRPQKRVASQKIQLTIFISISIRSSMCINIAQGAIVFIDRAKKILPSCSLFITEYAFDNGLKCSVSYASQNLENRKQKIKKKWERQPCAANIYHS